MGSHFKQLLLSQEMFDGEERLILATRELEAISGIVPLAADGGV
jgi:hypothetical protein